MTDSTNTTNTTVAPMNIGKGIKYNPDTKQYEVSFSYTVKGVKE